LIRSKKASVNTVDIREAVENAGLAWRGAFHATPQDNAPAETKTVVLLGFTGARGWPAFAASDEASDQQPHPLDRWSRRIIGGMAEAWGAVAFYPFGGPLGGQPGVPFLRWAQRAEAVHPSPLGLFIHPTWGLWHSYRGALALPHLLDLSPREESPSPCAQCDTKPCLSACPVNAFSANAAALYDVPRCKSHLATTSGTDCLQHACAARRACPVGAAYCYETAQASFHMRAFYPG